MVGLTLHRRHRRQNSHVITEAPVLVKLPLRKEFRPTGRRRPVGFRSDISSPAQFTARLAAFLACGPSAAARLSDFRSSHRSPRSAPRLWLVGRRSAVRPPVISLLASRRSSPAARRPPLGSHYPATATPSSPVSWGGGSRVRTLSRGFTASPPGVRTS